MNIVFLIIGILLMLQLPVMWYRHRDSGDIAIYSGLSAAVGLMLAAYAAAKLLFN